jgi:Fe2+ or Zn2+ uptake regulation protein
MTVPHTTRTLAPASVPAAITTLRVRGLRVSAARRLVLEALFAADEPVTAETIAAGLDGRLPSSDLASVYRYALAGRHQGGYVACEGCGAHRPLDRATVAHLTALLREACGYEPQLVHFPIVGRCPECDAHS